MITLENILVTVLAADRASQRRLERLLGELGSPTNASFLVDEGSGKTDFEGWCQRHTPSLIIAQYLLGEELTATELVNRIYPVPKLRAESEIVGIHQRGEQQVVRMRPVVNPPSEEEIAAYTVSPPAVFFVPRGWDTAVWEGWGDGFRRFYLRDVPDVAEFVSRCCAMAFQS